MFPRRAVYVTFPPSPFMYGVNLILHKAHPRCRGLKLLRNDVCNHITPNKWMPLKSLSNSLEKGQRWLPGEGKEAILLEVAFDSKFPT